MIVKNEDGSYNIPMNEELNLITGRKDNGTFKVSRVIIEDQIPKLPAHDENGNLVEGKADTPDKNGHMLVAPKTIVLDEGFIDKQTIINQMLNGIQFAVNRELDDPTTWQILETDGVNISSNGFKNSH